MNYVINLEIKLNEAKYPYESANFTKNYCNSNLSRYTLVVHGLMIWGCRDTLRPKNYKTKLVKITSFYCSDLTIKTDNFQYFCPQTVSDTPNSCIKRNF